MLLAVASALGTLYSHEAAAQDAASYDVYGRPLADQLGPIEYLQVGDGWIAIHADGCQEPMPSITPEDAFAPTVGLTTPGYSLDSLWTYSVGSYPYAVAIGDVTGDGHADGRYR